MECNYVKFNISLCKNLKVMVNKTSVFFALKITCNREPYYWKKTSLYHEWSSLFAMMSLQRLRPFSASNQCNAHSTAHSLYLYQYCCFFNSTMRRRYNSLWFLPEKKSQECCQKQKGEINSPPMRSCFVTFRNLCFISESEREWERKHMGSKILFIYIWMVMEHVVIYFHL
jgi:hypothetical protein